MTAEHALRAACMELSAEGRPCPANPRREPDPDGRRRCYQHSQDPVVTQERALARDRGARVNRYKALPPDTPLPRFTSRQAVVRWAERTAHLVLTGVLDPRLAAEARGLATLALQAHELAAVERLDDLERVIEGRAVW
jgi:hypothetical protein